MILEMYLTNIAFLLYRMRKNFKNIRKFAVDTLVVVS